MAIAAPCCAFAQSSQAGRKIAQRDCGACHATGARDRSRLPAAPPFRTLGERYDVEGLAESLAEGISVGHPKMPVLVYPPSQVGDLVTYLKRLQPSRPTTGGVVR